MRPTTATRAPAAVDKLLALTRAAGAFEGVQIEDGSPLAMPETPDVVVFGASTADQPGVQVTYTRETGLGRVAYVEQVEVLTTISCWSGDDAADLMKRQRDRVLTLFGALQSLLAANQTVPDVWDGVELGDRAEWYMVPNEDGVTVAVGFFLVSRSVV